MRLKAVKNYTKLKIMESYPKTTKQARKYFADLILDKVGHVISQADQEDINVNCKDSFEAIESYVWEFIINNQINN